jgi:hypothetical protein
MTAKSESPEDEVEQVELQEEVDYSDMSSDE